MYDLKFIAVRCAAAALAAATIMTFNGAARADAVFFGYRSAPWQHGPHHGHRQYYRPYAHYPYYAQSVVVVAPPTVVYSSPPPVYAPAPVLVPPVTLVPASPIYQTTDGRYCREYQSVITVDGTARDSFGTACYAPDGTWRIVN